MSFKSLVIVISALVFVRASAQLPLKTYTLRGHLTGMYKDSVLIDYAENALKSTIIARPIVNGEFIITDKIAGPTRVFISFKDKGKTTYRGYFPFGHDKEIFLEPGVLTVTGDATEPDSLRLTGSKSETELEELDQLTASACKERQNMLNAAIIQNNLEQAARASSEVELYPDKVNSASYAFFLKHPNSYVTASKLLDCADRMSLDSIKFIYANFNYELKQSAQVKALSYAIKRIEETLPGNQAIDFSTMDINGNNVRLKDQKEKYTILNFVSAWNDASKKSDKHLLQLYNKYAKMGLNIISINKDDWPGAHWEKTITQDSTEAWSHVKWKFDQSDIFKQYHIYALPTKILIDRSGKIIARFEGYNSRDADIDQMLLNIFKE